MSSTSSARPVYDPGRRLEVRPARPNDVSKLSAFFLEAWRQAGPGALGFAGATDESVSEIASEKFLRSRIASPVTQIVVAESGGRIVGFASVRRLERGDGELSAMVVLESETGKGIGTRLIRKSLESAKRRGCRSLVVKTEESNGRAIRFYKSAGFIEAGKVQEKIGRTKVSLELLAKRLR